jgi:hypothetical protein
MDKQVMSHRQPEAGPSRPLGEIIIVKEPQPEPLVEPADLVVDGTLHEHAKP